MKFELEVVRFNEEDVIATSGAITPVCSTAEHLKVYSANGTSASVIYFGVNPDGTIYDSRQNNFTPVNVSNAGNIEKFTRAGAGAIFYPTTPEKGDWGWVLCNDHTFGN